VSTTIERLQGFSWIFSNSKIAQNSLLSTVTEELRIYKIVLSSVLFFSTGVTQLPDKSDSSDVRPGNNDSHND
jgi:hypothetical protein